MSSAYRKAIPGEGGGGVSPVPPVPLPSVWEAIVHTWANIVDVYQPGKYATAHTWIIKVPHTNAGEGIYVGNSQGNVQDPTKRFLVEKGSALVLDLNDYIYLWASSTGAAVGDKVEIIQMGTN